MGRYSANGRAGSSSPTSRFACWSASRPNSASATWQPGAGATSRGSATCTCRPTSTATRATPEADPAPQAQQHPSALTGEKPKPLCRKPRKPQNPHKLSQRCRVEDWRASCRVRWLARCFRSGPQSGSHGRVSSPRSSNRTCGIPRIRLSDEIMPSHAEGSWSSATGR